MQCPIKVQGRLVERSEIAWIKADDARESPNGAHCIICEAMRTLELAG